MAVSDGSRSPSPGNDPGVPAARPASARRHGLRAAALLVVLLGGLVWLAPWAPAGPATVEEVVALRCLTTDEALAGLEALLREEPASTIRAREGARVLSLRTTPPLLERARAWLAEHDAGCLPP